MASSLAWVTGAERGNGAAAANGGSGGDEEALRPAHAQHPCASPMPSSMANVMPTAV